MQQFQMLNQQQQPFIRSGYNAMGRLNTLLGLGGRPSPSAPPSAGNQMYRPTPGGGVQQIVAAGQPPSGMPSSSPKSNPRLAQLLALRAQNGDTEAQRILGGMQ